jgi:hypothetical protein
MADRGRERVPRSRSPSKGGEPKKSKKEKKAERDRKKVEAKKILETLDSDETSDDPGSSAAGARAVAVPENSSAMSVELMKPCHRRE